MRLTCASKGSGHLYRAVDKEGLRVDFLLTPTRDWAAAAAFLSKAIRTQGFPKKITIDQSGSNTAAIQRYNGAHKTAIRIRPCRYLNNIVEQDHRAVKRMTRPIWGSSPLWRRAVRLPALRSYTQIAKGNWQSSDRSRTRQPNNSTHSLPMGQQPVRVFYVVTYNLRQNPLFSWETSVNTLIPEPPNCGEFL